MRKHTITVTLVIIFSFALLSALAYAADAPTLPEFFYGKAAVNGRNVPINSTIIAKISNEKRGEIKVDTAGYYGKESTSEKLLVAGSRSTIGKYIEFYVKIPRLQEIKATQTFKWEPGSTNNLNLTFNGAEIPVNDTNSTEIGQINETKELFFYSSLIAGKQLSIPLDNPNIPITRLQLITTKNLTNVTFEFEAVENPDVPKLKNVYKYIWINVDKVQQNDVQTAILKFKVSNDWFENYDYDPGKVKLWRYHNNTWDELQTVHEGNDTTHNYYRASTPGFSYFAITSEKAEKKEAKEEAPVEKKPAVEFAKKEAKEEKPLKGNEEPSNKITGLAVGEGIKQNYWMFVAFISIGMLAGIALTYFIVIRKRSE